LPIDRIRKQLAERVAVDVRQRQRRLIGVLAGARIVVVEREDIDCATAPVMRLEQSREATKNLVGRDADFDTVLE